MSVEGLMLAVQFTQRESMSALPDAPVVVERERRQLKSVRLARRATARALRLAAERVEPVRQYCD